MSPNLSAFLSMIAVSEGTAGIGADGYDVLVGSTKRQPLLFGSYHDHPRAIVSLNDHLRSSAAGRYQILARYFDAYRKQLSLPDFSPASQDAIAIQMIKERGALDDVENGRLLDALRKCANIWASFPGAGYGQHENRISDLQQAYENAGGKLS